MKRMLDDVLQFVRLEEETSGADAKGTPATQAPVDLDDLLREVLQDLAARVQAQHALVDVEAPLGRARGHRTMLALLMQNLLANALKFVPPGRAPQVRVRARREGGMLRLEVHDNGIGIESARIAELGTPFRRLHARRKYEGTGLGLAISRRIAQQHGGTIEISSVPGEGSCFSVVLPDDPVE